MQDNNFKRCSRDAEPRGMALLYTHPLHDQARAGAVANWYNGRGFDVLPIGVPAPFRPLGTYAATIADALRAIRGYNREYPVVIFDGGASAAAVQLALAGDKIGESHHFFVSGDTTEREWRAVVELTLHPAHGKMKQDVRRAVSHVLHPLSEQWLEEFESSAHAHADPPLEGLFRSVTTMGVAGSRGERRRNGVSWMHAHQHFGAVDLVCSSDPVVARAQALDRILAAA